MTGNQWYNMLMKEGDKQAGWKYTGAKEGSAAANQPAGSAKPVGTVSWTASEYVAHDKSVGWYVRFGLVAVISIALIYLVTDDILSVVVLGILAVGFGYFAARKPDTLQYQIDSRGITIGQKFYPISLFRSFAVIEEGAFRSITLLPMKRFMPAISLYFAPDNEQSILEAFGNLLPQEVRKQDPLDKFMHRIRF